jgi:acetyl-CoA carboxylase alpha subunit
MSDETPATATDPALGSEGDTDQLPLEDTLEERNVDDLLDEGYVAPESPRTNRYGETAWEQAHRETLEQRLAEEEPEVWAARHRADVGREPDRAGRLVEDDEAVEAGGNDEFAVDAGISGGAASAEEAAVHLIDEESTPDVKDDEDDEG